MKKEHRFLRITAWCLLSAAVLAGCTEPADVADSQLSPSDAGIKLVPVPYGSDGVTRVSSANSWDDLSSFSAFAYCRTWNKKAKKVKDPNVSLITGHEDTGSRYYRLENGSWENDGYILWQLGDTTSVFFLSPDVEKFSNIQFSMPGPQTFDREVENTDQVLTKVGSLLNFAPQANTTYTIPSGNPLSPFSISLRNGMKNVRVTVQSITLHNIISKGRFTFSTTVNGYGTWQPLKADGTLWADGTDARTALVTADYSCEGRDADGNVSERDLKLTVKGSVPLRADNVPCFYIMQNEIKSWEPSGVNDLANSTRQADMNALAYFEVKCRIIDTDDDGNDVYLVGWSDERNEQDPDRFPKYESIYLPYDLSNPNYQPQFNVQIPYVMTFAQGAMYNNLGGLITDHNGSMENFINAEWIDFENGDDDVDTWTDDGTPIDLEI